jgi:hypothetical protein
MQLFTYLHAYARDQRQMIKSTQAKIESNTYTQINTYQTKAAWSTFKIQQVQWLQPLRGEKLHIYLCKYIHTG